MACALDVAVEPSRARCSMASRNVNRATTDRDQRLRRLKMYRRVPRAANVRDGDSSLPLGDEPPSAAVAAGNAKTHSDFDLRSDEITR